MPIPLVILLWIISSIVSFISFAIAINTNSVILWERYRTAILIICFCIGPIGLCMGFILLLAYMVYIVWKGM